MVKSVYINLYSKTNQCCCEPPLPCYITLVSNWTNLLVKSVANATGPAVLRSTSLRSLWSVGFRVLYLHNYTEQPKPP